MRALRRISGIFLGLRSPWWRDPEIPTDLDWEERTS
jgi:hypothetical protein